MIKLSSKKQILGGVVVLLVIALFIVLFVSRGKDNQPADSATEATETTEETLNGTPKAPGTSATAPSTTKTTSGGCSTSLSISKNTQLRALVLKWNACTKDNFQLYSLYRNGAVIEKSSDKNLANYVDKNLVSGTTYTYKVCVSQAPEIFTCSNTVSSKF